MVIKIENERLFVNLEDVAAVWSDSYRHDHYNVGAGIHSFEVSRPVGEQILDALEERESELDRILEMGETVGQWIGRATKAEALITRLRSTLDAVLGQWVADTAGETTNPKLYDEAKALADARSAPADPPKQVTS
jgi:hypothetical protein